MTSLNRLRWHSYDQQGYSGSDAGCCQVDVLQQILVRFGAPQKIVVFTKQGER